MSVAENNANFDPLKRIVRGVQDGYHFARKKPALAVAYAASPAIILGFSVYNAVCVAPQQRIEAQQRASADATATAVAIDLITRDYNTTGGVDLVRNQESYQVTQRGSARLAGSEAALLDNAWARIRRESGCQPAETVVIPGRQGEHFWDQSTPTSYVIRVNC